MSEHTLDIILCIKCNVTFTNKYTLNAHMKKQHNEDIVLAAGNQICGMCEDRFKTISQLQDHMESKHDVALIFLKKVFYTVEDFLNWKAEEEKESISSFIVSSTYTNKDTHTKHSYYRCHRSGVPDLKTDRKRRVKVKGSIKVGKICPAMMKVENQTIDNTTEIRVTYQSVHVGHDLEVGRLNLHHEERMELASSMRMGVPLSKILDKTREKYSPSKRFGLTTRQDLHNIKRDFNIKSDVVMHSDDTTSVEIIVHEMQNDPLHPILVYQPHGDLMPDYPAVTKDDFMEEDESALVIATEPNEGVLAEKSALVEEQLKKKHHLTSTNSVHDALSKLQQACKGIQNEEVNQYVLKELKWLTTYIQCASSSRPDFPKQQNKSEVPPKKLLQKRKSVIQKTKRARLVPQKEESVSVESM